MSPAVRAQHSRLQPSRSRSRHLRTKGTIERKFLGTLRLGFFGSASFGSSTNRGQEPIAVRHRGILSMPWTA